MNGLYFVLDVNSGAVHVLDGLAYEAMAVFNGVNDKEVQVALGSKYGEGEIVEVLAELHELKDQGLLFAPEVTTPVTFREKPLVKSLCLHVAHDCNLRCGYCFAGTGDFGHDRSLMPKHVAEQAIDFIIANSGARKNCEVDFFGGEPLLNMETVRHAVSYIRKREAETGKVFKLTLTTNAALLNNSIIEYLNSENISVVLSLDGRREVHDAMRPYADGSGSFDEVVAGAKQLVDSRQGQSYYMRGTFTAHNLDFAADVKAMVDLGFKQLSIEPVIAKEEEYALKEEHLPVLFSEYENLAKYYLDQRAIGQGFEFFHFNLDLSNGPCVAKRLSGCGAGHEYFAVTPDGDLYPCHQFVGRDNYLLGNVSEGIKKSKMTEVFRQAHVLNKSECRECWARFYCSGGCHANADLFNATIDKPYLLGCELQKKRLECALMIQACLTLQKGQE
ncbi:MAG: anaerobic sulfatase-maturating enzyme [Firmicutes bacterium]|nr:anaerobic sulfatase-maturating enzyme [Bacillota bacterium]